MGAVCKRTFFRDFSRKIGQFFSLFAKNSKREKCAALVWSIKVLSIFIGVLALILNVAKYNVLLIYWSMAQVMQSCEMLERMM